MVSLGSSDYGVIGIKIFSDDRITPFTVFRFLTYSLRDIEVGLICKLHHYDITPHNEF